MSAAGSAALPADAAPLSAAPALRRMLGALCLRVAGLLVLLALWELAARGLAGTIPIADQMGPGPAFGSLWSLLAGGHFTADIIASLRRVLLSLAIALAAGIVIGVAVGLSRLADAFTSGAFQFLRMISPLSWMPIAVMVFGIGDAPVYFLLAITAVWPIVLGTAAGVRALDPQWLLLVRSLGANRREALRHVVLPGILGHILTGGRVAIGMVWILLIPCEMLGVSSGLGYFILDSRDRLAWSELMAAIVLIGVLGLLLDGAAQWLRVCFGATSSG